MRYFFDISYHGKHYHGWQKQKNALSVEQVVTEALSNISGEQVKCVGSSRTDTGVHAEQQIFHADIIKTIKTDKLCHRLNRYLPKDIYIKSIRRVKEKAHARFDALDRTYEYRIRRNKNPFDHDLAYHYYPTLDVRMMKRATKLLLGKHDFQCFSRTRTDVNHFECDVKLAEWIEKDNQLVFKVTSNRFLRGMVKAMVGTFLKIGKGKISINELKKIVESRDRKRAGESVPSKGLFLVAVSYPEEIYLD